MSEAKPRGRACLSKLHAQAILAKGDKMDDSNSQHGTSEKELEATPCGKQLRKRCVLDVCLDRLLSL